MIVGKGKNALSPDEYVFGALTVYTDVVFLFLSILSVVGIASR